MVEEDKKKGEWVEEDEDMGECVEIHQSWRERELC